MHLVREGSSPFRGTPPSLELELLKNKKFLYGSVAMGTVVLLIVSNDGETKSLVNDPANTIGPPPEWPNGP